MLYFCMQYYGDASAKHYYESERAERFLRMFGLQVY